MCSKPYSNTRFRLVSPVWGFWCLVDFVEQECKNSTLKSEFLPSPYSVLLQCSLHYTLLTFAEVDMLSWNYWHWFVGCWHPPHQCTTHNKTHFWTLCINCGYMCCKQHVHTKMNGRLPLPLHIQSCLSCISHRITTWNSHAIPRSLNILMMNKKIKILIYLFIHSFIFSLFGWVYD